jgi:hypothetical protein
VQLLSQFHINYITENYQIVTVYMFACYRHQWWQTCFACCEFHGRADTLLHALSCAEDGVLWPYEVSDFQTVYGWQHMYLTDSPE